MSLKIGTLKIYIIGTIYKKNYVIEKMGKKNVYD